MPPDGPRLPPRRRRSPSERNSATFLALAGLLGFAVALIALVAIILPQAQGLILVVVGAGLFFVLHYLLWGHWLNRIVEREQPTEPTNDADQGTGDTNEWEE